MERSGKVDFDDETFGNISQLNSMSGGESGVVGEPVEFQEIPLEDVIGEILDSPTILNTENRQSESRGNDRNDQPIPGSSRCPRTGNQSGTGQGGNNGDQDTNSEDSMAAGLLKEIDQVLKEPEESSAIPKQHQKDVVKPSIKDDVRDADEGQKNQGERRRSSFGYHDGPDEEVSLMLFSNEVPKRRRDSLGDFTVIPNDLTDNEKMRIGAAGKGDDCAELEVGIDAEFGDAGGNVKVEKLEVKAEIPKDGDVEDQEEIPQDAGLSDNGADTWNEHQIGERNGSIANRSNAVCNQDVENGRREGNDERVRQDVENGEGQDDISEIIEDSVILPEAQDCTYIEAWSTFAMGLGVMPYRIIRTGLTSEKRGGLWNKVIWGVSIVLLTATMATYIPHTISTFSKKESESTNSFLKVGTYIGFVLMACTFWRIISMKEKHLLNANNRVDYSNYKHCKLSKKGKLIFLITLTVIMAANTSLFLFIKTNPATTDDNDFTIKDAVNMLECRGQEVLTWNIKNCHHSEYMSKANVVWSMIGFTSITLSIVMETAIVLGIITCCGVFFLAVLEIRRKQSANEDPINLANVVTEADYANLSDLAEELSKFIGECTLAYLMYHSMETPNLMKLLFSGSVFVFLSIIIKQGTIFMGLLLAATSSLWMKKIGEKLTRREFGQPRLVGSARVRAFVTEMLFKKHTGIGYPGLFVITFPFLFSYIGFLATSYTVLV